MRPYFKSMSVPSFFLLLLSASSLVASEVITKPDGLKYEDTHPVSCDRPTKNGDTIAVHYRGTLEDGKVFDESRPRGSPFIFKLGGHQVIQGWDEGLLDMCIGTQRKLTIPSKLGYGARGQGPIPPDATLIFETELMHIQGVPDPTSASTMSSPSVSPTASSSPLEDHDKTKAPPNPVPDQNKQPPGAGHPSGPADAQEEAANNECRLLGPFALIVQAALGVLALLSLVFKRWRERPRRPLQIWFFDVSKQVVGTALLHVANLAMSMLSSGIDAAQQASEIVEATKTEDNRVPNPCSFYLLNLAIDTTIGIPILVVLLRLLHAIFLRTPLANPPESLKSGHYGSPPHVSWWIKQSFIYFIGLFGMKLFVLFMFSALPWLPWIGDWALRWTEGNESVQIAFVMFIFPLAMNAIQYYIIDTFIKEDKNAGDEEGYESVRQDEDRREGEEDERSALRDGMDDDEEDENKAVANSRRHESQGEGSQSGSPPSNDGIKRGV